MFTYDATNIRLRNITLGYTFNKNLLKKTPFQKLRLSATCNNVWMIVSHLPGIDPESVAASKYECGRIREWWRAYKSFLYI